MWARKEGGREGGEGGREGQVKEEALQDHDSPHQRKRSRL
jgi:hypothetical protein